MADVRAETDSLGNVDVPADKLWGAQTQRSLEHFSIGREVIPREMIASCAIPKKGAAISSHEDRRLADEPFELIVTACDEILAGQHHDMFPLHVWMTGSGTQFNVNEVISNRCCQLAGTPLGSHAPVHPNDPVNMAQSSNDSFPSAMNIATASNAKQRLLPAVQALHDAIAAKAEAWKDIVKIGRTRMQDATPLTLGQEYSGYAGLLADGRVRLESALQDGYKLALGGTAVGTGINSAPGFDADAAAQIGNDIRLMSCGPRAGIAELDRPANEPGSSIMPGKVNPTQAETLTLVAAQVMANDVAVDFGGAGGCLEMNVYKPLIIHNITRSISVITDSCSNFRKFMIEGTAPKLEKIGEYVEHALMRVTALSQVIGCDKASKIAHYAMANGPKLNGQFIPLAVGAYLMSLGTMGGPFQGAAMNPARAFGPDLAHGDLSTWCAYIVGPVLWRAAGRGGGLDPAWAGQSAGSAGRDGHAAGRRLRG